jgi:hypothetical protein
MHFGIIRSGNMIHAIAGEPQPFVGDVVSARRETCTTNRGGSGTGLRP